MTFQLTNQHLVPMVITLIEYTYEGMYPLTGKSHTNHT